MNTLIQKIRNSCGLEILCALVVIGAYAYALTFDFQRSWDDSLYVFANSKLAFTSENLEEYFRHGMLELWTPLTAVSLMLDNLVWGNSEPFGYHLTNILLHAVNAVLVLRILKELGISGWYSLLFTLLWAVHPQHIESVAWIAERKDVLSGLFALGAVLAFMRAMSRGRVPWLACVLFVLGICAKPSVIGTPVLWGIWLWWKKPDLFNWKRVLVFWGLACGGAGFIAWMMNFFPKFLPFAEAVPIALHNILFYFADSVIPLYLNPCYPLVENWDFQLVLLSSGLFAVLFAIGIRAGISKKNLLAGFVCFGLAYLVYMAPVTGVFRFSPTDYADRYSYLPGFVVWAGLAFFTVSVLRRKPEFKRAFMIWTAASLVFSGYRFAEYLPCWKNSEALFAKALEYEFPNDRAVIYYAAMGLDDNNAVFVRRCADLFRKKAELYGTRPYADTAMMLDFAASSMEKNLERSAAILVRLLKGDKPELIQFQYYLEGVKKQTFIFYSLPENQPYLQSYLEWAVHAGRPEGVEPDIDWVILAAYHCCRKDWPGAKKAWEEYLKKHPEDAETRKNIETMTRLISGNSGALKNE